MASDGSEVNIKVAIRIRPLNERETAKNVVQIVTTDGKAEGTTLNIRTAKKEGPKKIEETKTYHFDKVFGTRSSQGQVFNSMVAPIVDEAMQGFNCTVFAYGQTGTGKVTQAASCPSAYLVARLFLFSAQLPCLANVHVGRGQLFTFVALPPPRHRHTPWKAPSTMPRTGASSPGVCTAFLTSSRRTSVTSR